MSLIRFRTEQQLSVWLDSRQRADALPSLRSMQWLLMPAAAGRFRRWLDPVDGAGLRISLIGAVAVAAVNAATLLIFATVTWLQFWDFD